MRYARIENDTVLEFFSTELDIKDLFHPSLTWVVCEDPSVQLGYTYDFATKVFSPKPVDPAAENALRASSILAELDTIDMRSVRPLRAKVAGTATPEDERILSELEARAAVLRAELVTLV